MEVEDRNIESTTIVSYVGDLDGKEGGSAEWTEWRRRRIKKEKGTTPAG
jgi:hypothetical protein